MKKILGAVLAAIISSGAAQYKIEGRYPLLGAGSFDYVTLDNSARRIYISHATQVEVVDADSGKNLGSIPDTPGVHGIAIASEFGHGFTSNGRENKVSMFDLATLKLIRKIDVGEGPDGIYYDQSSKRIFTNNHGAGDVTAINAATGNVEGTVPLNGDGEEAVFGADGLIYVNSENTAEVVAFDPQSLEVKRRLPIGVAKTPTGLAYDPETNRLFIGTRKHPMAVMMDAASGRVITTFPIAEGVDYASFDPESHLIFFSCAEGKLNIFHEKSAEEFEEEGAVDTLPGAKTMAFDPTTKRIFLPAAEYEEVPSTDPMKAPERVMKAGSFALLIVGKTVEDRTARAGGDGLN